MTGASRARVALLLVLTFVAGLAAGIAADRVLLSSTASATADEAHGERAHGKDRGRHGGTTIERFADELGLTEEQRARIDPILEDTKQRMSELFDPVRPAYRAVVDSARARIEAILTPEQVTQYRRLLERRYGHDDDSESDRRGEPDPENENDS